MTVAVRWLRCGCAVTVMCLCCACAVPCGVQLFYSFFATGCPHFSHRRDVDVRICLLGLAATVQHEWSIAMAGADPTRGYPWPLLQVTVHARHPLNWCCARCCARCYVPVAVDVLWLWLCVR